MNFTLAKKNKSVQDALHRRGNPFWGKCQAYRCAQKQQVEHCGECTDFPCESLINDYYDPNRPKGKQEKMPLA